MPSAATDLARFDLDAVTAFVRRYQRIQGLGGWTFSVRLVPGLMHQGAPAWAVVDSRPEFDPEKPDEMRGHADIAVRDLRATPMPGFDGDVWREIRVTLSHELWHPWVTWLLRKPSVAREERFVEAAAQAVVACEGDEARVMARSLQAVMADAIPGAVRARLGEVSARASLRARGGTMDPEKIKALIAAIKEQNGEAALKIAEDLLVEAASGEVAPNSETAEAHAASAPPGEAAKVGTVSAEQQPGMDDGAAARRAKEGDMSDEDKARRARQRAEDDAITAFRRGNAKNELVSVVRARLAGHSGLPAIEKRIADAPDFVAAQTIADIAIEMAGTGQQRARSGVEHDVTPSPKPPEALPTVDALRAEGFTDSWLIGYASALKSGQDVAASFLEQARMPGSRARKAQPQNGGK